MKESLWGYYLVLLGIVVSTVMILLSNMTTTNQQNYYLLKEVTNAAMIDAIDFGYYREYGTVKINTEKFVENFLRRFSEGISKTNTYKIDFYSISAHKINALKGVGALIRKKRVNLTPLIFGGGQEDGLRSGTENVFGIKVFENATTNHYKNILLNFNLVSSINDYIRKNLNEEFYKILSTEEASPYILSISAIGIRGEVLMHCLEQEGIIVGNGSACSSRNRFSRVIEACGYNKEVLDGVIRLSFSSENTIEEAKTVVNTLNVLAKKLKGIMR